VAKSLSRILLDLNSPEFQAVLFGLEIAELKQVIASLRRLRGLPWLPRSSPDPR
jgi:hypothetical protein